MSTRDRDYTRIDRMLVLTVLVVMHSVGAALAQEAPCTAEQRREALRSMQTEVLALAPSRLDSLVKAIAPGGPLAGWILSHGHVVLSHGVCLSETFARRIPGRICSCTRHHLPVLRPIGATSMDRTARTS